ncbi:MAG TPA: histidine ammonia-lyase [Synergistaceae bacterium]|nr:histidine ammonia-lyase [Synergistaceae bacterium]HPJ24612.1 histidine ammonia-lyase [Synergistaceae bacterium]HPQ36193.1 histidine ammonia-lyase [Synergistaceae bacterium]
MEAKTILLNGHSLSLEDVCKVARQGYRVRLDPGAVALVQRGAEKVASWVREERSIYGITTGFGDLSSVVIPKDQSRQLQTNLLLSHACGTGDYFPEEVVRAIMLLRINTLTRGFSGISLPTLERLVEYLNLGIHPLIPAQGSVGASGDLCPLSHLAITLLGYGKVRYQGKDQDTMDVLRLLGMEPIALQPKEGLALNNGTQALTAVGALALVDAQELAKIADIAAALSLEALHGVPYAFDPRTHDLRPHLGQKLVASNMRKLIEGSQIVEKYKHDRVQDAYSLRCVPQVHGASRDAFEYVKQKIQIEINSVTDNPLIFAADEEALSGGNFHGQPIAIAMDFFAIGAAELGSISERRTARMVDHKLSGLPPFLVNKSGLNNGFMIPQYVSAALVSENKVLCHPSSVDSIPTSANQEDHVSMGMFSSRKAVTVVDNIKKILAIELLSAAQGLEFSKPLLPGKGTHAAYKAIREEIASVEEDRYFHPDILSLIALLEEGTILRAVEETVGEL